ncbi:21908_t:CDS:1 [Gigaspora rosea]|nr:21908_t:CDS:1 [Gigaspora rosea]
MSKKEVSRDNIKKEWILLRGKENEPVVKRIIEKRKCKILTENWRMVEDTNSLAKSPGKGFQYLERQEESGSSESAKWLTKSRILSFLPRPVVKEEKRVRLIPTDMLEEMVHPEAPISKEKKHIAEDVVIEDIDIGMIRQQKVGREMEETLEQQLQSNRE